MILYFADRQLNILGQATTYLPEGLKVTNDKMLEDVETGVATFECEIPFDDETRRSVEAYTEVGNYLLYSNGEEREFFTITESELDTGHGTVYIYAEDDGMDLLNVVFDDYEADKAYSIDHYINMFAAGTGFVIRTNEAKGLSRKLAFSGEATGTARIASVATEFDGCEVSYGFEVEGLMVTKKYIDIYEKRGKDVGATLWLNKDIDSIVTSKSINNLATALQCTGGTPEKAENPITLQGYKYDDGDFYVDGKVLKSRVALKQWARYQWKDDDSSLAGGHIVRPYSYDTTSQKTLCSQAISELKKLRDMEVNYQVDILKLPDNVRIGDRVNIVDEKGALFLSARVLQLQRSEADKEYKATIGEYLIKKSGIHQKVLELAEQFAKQAKSAARALMIADTAQTAANAAQAQADAAASDAANAQAKANEAVTAANTATQSAQAATEAAGNAQAAVETVGKSVEGLETTVANAQAAANQAQQAAATAETKATEARQSAVNAQAKAEEAATAAGEAKTTADSAVGKADTAKTAAEQAIAEAEKAATTAAAAKQDAANAQKDIDSLGDSLTTLSNTMSADYARKTDLTETKASLQTQISQNAAGISSTASRVQTIDETTNEAQKQLLGALSWVEVAQEQADEAQAAAEAAQIAATAAATAAANAQREADTAKAAAQAAQGVADKAEADLKTAKADLAAVQGRADATEAEIAAAQAAVNAAQAAADKANADAATAAQTAAEAQKTANTAAANAAGAQTTADAAATTAANAQRVAEEAQGDASAAQAKAAEAAQAAEQAQETANAARANAENAQATADAAAKAAATAQQEASVANAKVTQAASNLAAAQQNLANVMADADSTADDVAEAEAAVAAAQSAATSAQQEAETAQAAAIVANARAQEAQRSADNAQAEANAANARAQEAHRAAAEAQLIVDGLAVRMASAETKITQNAEKIELAATKTEVTTTLGGYYTKKEADAAIQVKADSVTTTVRSEITEKIKDVVVGGRNLLLNSDIEFAVDGTGTASDFYSSGQKFGINIDEVNSLAGQEVTLSVYVKFTNVTFGGSALNRGGVELALKPASGSKTYISAWRIDAANFEGRISKTTKLPANVSFTDNDQPYLYVQGIVSGNAVVSRPKFEKGNKATDWSPAPEDLATAQDAETAQTAADDATSALARIEAAESAIVQLADSISMLVQKGDKSSQMVFDEDSATWSFNTGEIDDKINTNTDDIEALKSGVGDTNTNVENLQNKLGTWEEHISITTYEDEPCLMLYEEDSNYKQYVTNTRRIVTETVDGTETIKSKVDINTAMHENVVAKEKAQVGGFAWKKRGANRICLVWEGEDE